MSPRPHARIVNVGYRATNYWVVSAGVSRLLVDLGYPGTMGMMGAGLKRMGVPLGEIRYALATHYHIDHAGLAQELKQAGVPLLVLDTQVPAIPLMKRWTKPQDRYVDITLSDNVTIPCTESRALLARIGIAGEILPTPGHSDDCVSLLRDDGAVFTGDLTPRPRPERTRRRSSRRAGACCGTMVPVGSTRGMGRFGRWVPASRRRDRDGAGLPSASRNAPKHAEQLCRATVPPMMPTGPSPFPRLS